ncbi:CWF19-like protein 2 [Cyclospora cayetanensis]|uniref:CWF19-like protein 2 n=1 Tax=Cyclospora cayetanensis TaxID=88456 RepID=A0A6P6RZA5_9EIME|nr:CWF19-like protein 2 [Cyclospora cayetanensis]
MKSLVAFFASRGEAPLFLETVPKQAEAERQMAGLGEHTEIEVLPLPAERLKEARVYFRKAFDESEGFWQSHKTVIEAKGRQGVRAAIPKGFPYIYVDFSLEDGLAHVIEDGEEAYKSNIERLKRDYAPYDWTQAQPVHFSGGRRGLAGRVLWPSPLQAPLQDSPSDSEDSSLRGPCLPLRGRGRGPYATQTACSRAPLVGLLAVPKLLRQCSAGFFGRSRCVVSVTCIRPPPTERALVH